MGESQVVVFSVFIIGFYQEDGKRKGAVPYPADSVALDTKGQFAQAYYYSSVLEGSPAGVSLVRIVVSSQQSCVCLPATGSHSPA